MKPTFLIAKIIVVAL